MRLAFDSRLLSGRPSGVRDVALGLEKGLRQLHEDGLLELVLVGTNRSDPKLDVVLGGRAFMHVGLPIAAVRTRADRIFIPRQTVPWVSAVPVSALFHDIGFLRAHSEYERNKVRDVTTRKAAKAGNPLAVSDFTARELRDHGLTSRAVGLPIQAIHSLTWRPRIFDRYVLVVAAHEPHKNLVRLVKAWRSEDRRGLRLVICGRSGTDTARLLEEIAGVQSGALVEVVSDVDDVAYVKLLSECWAYIQPSIYEGLCIPALDLVAAGAPIAVGNLGNLGAVFANGPGALTFDPYSVSAISDALGLLVDDSETRNRLMRESQEVVRITDWRIVAEHALKAMSL